MTDEQIKEFISLKPQFVKYIYTCLKGATFFHPNDLINEAFIKLSKQKYPILNVKTAGLFYIKITFLEEKRRASKKPLLKNVFVDNTETITIKSEEDNYQGNTLIHSNYDFNKISKILNSYPDQEVKNITWLKYQGYNKHELSKLKKELNLSVDDDWYKLKKLKLHVSKNLDLDYHKIERNKNIKQRNKNIPIIVKTINLRKKRKKDVKSLILELKSKNLKNIEIARQLNISKSLVGKYINDENNKNN